LAREEIIGDCRLILGDCLEILPTLGKVDAAVTDPPYGLSGSSGTINLERAKAVYESASDTLDDVRDTYVPIIKQCRLIAKRVAVTPGTPHSFEYPKPDDIAAVIQPAVAGMSKWGRPTWQPVLFYGKDPRSGLTIQPLTVTITDVPERNGHPCPKPIATMLWMVERASLPGEIVLDPFMGSGTTGVACVNLGRKFIGIEIEPRYFDIACRRIEEAYKQPRLFAEPAPKPQQVDLL
jgi:site-specific DNA-methyltransferase (adenine-specific)